MQTMQTIPKIIHYCWFGRGKKSKLIQKCIDSWHTFFPDYRLIEWNEDNCDISSMPRYVQEAYSVKKYAFVSDYVRFVALYKEGGIYLDTDIEVLKNFDFLIKGYMMVVGFEHLSGLSTGIIIAKPNLPILKEFIDSYRERTFIRSDGGLDLTTVNEKFNILMQQYGVILNGKEQYLESGIKVYPIDVFSSFDMRHWHEQITENSVTVHHMSGSWSKITGGWKWKIVYLCRKIFGIKITDKIQDFISRSK